MARVQSWRATADQSRACQRRDSHEVLTSQPSWNLDTNVDFAGGFGAITGDGLSVDDSSDRFRDGTGLVFGSGGLANRRFPRFLSITPSLITRLADDCGRLPGSFSSIVITSADKSGGTVASCGGVSRSLTKLYRSDQRSLPRNPVDCHTGGMHAQPEESNSWVLPIVAEFASAASSGRFARMRGHLRNTDPHRQKWIRVKARWCETM
jgi:hypothetical protein